MTEARFEGDGPVARYWLSRCEGFEVAGEARGVVERLIRDADPFVTTRLVVRTRSRRRKVIAVSAVTSVDPAGRVLVVERHRRRAEPRRPARRETPASYAVWLRRAGAAAGTSLQAGASTLVEHAPIAKASTGRALHRVRAAIAAAVAAATPRVKAAWATTVQGGSAGAAHARSVLAPATRALRRSLTLLWLEVLATVRMLRTEVASALAVVRRAATRSAPRRPS